MDMFSHLTALSDPTRTRLLLVLERHELTVSELCAILQLPQSTVSRHLKVLGDENLVSSRADGTSRRYRMRARDLEAPVRKLWQLVREQTTGSPAAQQDAQRLQGVLAQRRSASREFFSSTAGQWDRVRTELFGVRSDLLGLLALSDPSWVIGDLGCGTGQMTEVLAPYVSTVIAVDESEAMLRAAKVRLESYDNVELRQGDISALPLDDAQLDVALLFLVLHYAPDPERILTEVARVLKDGGRILIVDMMPHDRAEFRDVMGHVWQGFAESDLERWTSAAGLSSLQYHPLPADPTAKGPTLFSAVAYRTAHRITGESSSPHS